MKDKPKPRPKQKVVNQPNLPRPKIDPDLERKMTEQDGRWARLCRNKGKMP